MDDNRRNFLKKGALLGLSGLAGSLLGKDGMDRMEQASQRFSDEPRFILPALDYSYSDLQPFIDRQTVEIHYTKHHQGYIDKLNALDPARFNFYTLNNDQLCRTIDNNSPAEFRNNMGGFYNHNLYWTLMKPNLQSKPNDPPPGIFMEALKTSFGSVENFKKEFTDKALKVFGSGWCWLIEKDLKLKIVTTANQDNPLMQVSPDQGPILMALDVWEHAYYLKYQNRRVEYINNWWNLVYWEKTAQRFLNK
jgi:Fe-Mn family superoxide dismutase